MKLITARVLRFCSGFAAPSLALIVIVGLVSFSLPLRAQAAPLPSFTTSIAVTNATGVHGGTTNLSATLTGNVTILSHTYHFPLPSQSLSFAIDSGSTVGTDATNGVGGATVSSVSLATIFPTTHTIDVSYAGVTIDIHSFLPSLPHLTLHVPASTGHGTLTVTANTGSSFEPSQGFTVASINGQNGWTSTGSYDQGVVANAYPYPTYGLQTLRISDAVTSGAFADQTFAAPLADSVGENGATAGTFTVGTRNSHFETQFDIAAAVPTEQAGLALSMSPDRGDGSRMSYLRFEDSSTGLKVFFDDYQGAPVNDFVETLVASGLSRTVPHTIKLTMDVVDGPGNDVVKVWVDGNLVHTGTSWEDYYRTAPEQAPEQTPRIVKTLIFREGGTAHPTNAGKGFLIDNFSMSASVPTPPADTTVDAPTLISPANGSSFTTAAITHMDWTDVTDPSGPVTYRYQSSLSSATNPDGSFASPAYTSPAPLTDSEIPTPNTPEGTYYWHAQAIDGLGNVSAWSDTWTVTVDNTAPHVPVLTSPADGVTLLTNEFDFLWNASVDNFPGPLTYDYQATQDATQVGGVLTNNLWHSGVLTTNSIHSSGAGDGTWYWQVRAKDAAGNWSGWSTIWSVILNTVVPPTDTTGTIEITKYACPEGTSVVRSANGVGGTVPDGCTPESGVHFGYVHGAQTDANSPYPELAGPFVDAGTTLGNGVLAIAHLASEGRYLVAETNADGQQLASSDVLGLYCTGDGDTSDSNDNQELTFVSAGGTTKCVAYDVAPPTPASCTVTSDTTTQVAGHDSAVLTFVHSAWALISGAHWIWGEDGVTDPTVETTEVFTKTVHVDSTPTSASLEIAADNGYLVKIDGATVDDQLAVDANFNPTHTLDVTSYLPAGNHIIEITVRNGGVAGASATDNPAGLIYKLTVNGSDCSVIAPTPTSYLKVHILKYLKTSEGIVPATGDLPAFPMSASWSSANIGSGSGNYTLNSAGFGGAGAYAADTSSMQAPASYSTQEVPNGDTVLAADAQCSPGKYRLVGYKTGDTLSGALASETTTLTVPNFSNLSADKYVVVVNEKCPDATTHSEETVSITGDTSAGENLLGWMFGRDTSTQTPFSFNTDAASIGTGSLFVDPITNTVHGNSDKFIAELFMQTPISGLNSISYDYQIAAPDASAKDQFYMSVYATFGESSATKFYDCRYDVIPASGSTSAFTTVTFNPASTYTVTTSGTSPHVCPATPAGMQALSTSGTAKIRAIAINVGDTSGSDLGVSGYLDKVVTSITTGINTDTVTYDFEPTAPLQRGGGGPGVTISGSNNGDVGGTPEGQVKGESTSTPEALPEGCSPLLTSFLKMGANNDSDQVKKLQTFLNGEMKSSLPVTGFFGALTKGVVKSFQEKYWEDVLKPWAPLGFTDVHVGNGNVYKSTQWKINMLNCSTLETPFPDLH